MLDEWTSSSPAQSGLNEDFQAISLSRPESKIFSLDVLEQNAAKGHGLVTSVAAGNNVLLVSTSSSWIVHHEFGGGDNSELALSRGADQYVCKVFLDPSGRHCLANLRSSSGAETFYIHAKWKKVRAVSRLKGVLVNAVCWNKSQLSDYSSGEIVLATASGQIYEMLVEEKDKKEKYVKVLFELTELKEAFTGLQIENISSSTTTRYFIMAVTPTKLYVFVGTGSLESLFSSYAGRVVKFTELPGEFQKSEIHFYGKRYAESFAWLAGPGIYHGELHITTQVSEDSIVGSKWLLEYSKINEDGSSTRPEALSLTQHHFLLLYGGKLKVVNRTSQKLVEEDSVFDMTAPNMLGLCADYAAGAYYAYSNTSIFEITVHDEDRDMWRVYLGMKEYAAALEHCRNIFQKDEVYRAQADAAFEAKKYMIAASFYAKITGVITFEEIALKFLKINEQDALRTYLLRKLDSLGRDERSQITMVATWVVELYLDKMNQLLLHNDETQSQYAGVVEEFKAFLSDSKDTLDEATTLKLLTSYGRHEELVFFASLKNRYETVVNHHIQQRNAKKALAVLRRENVPLELQYKFAPALIMLDANETVEFWMSCEGLNPQNLIPALMRYSSISRPREEAHQAIKYLEFCVQRLKNEDTTIHNLLVSLLVKQGDEKELLKFLQVKYGREQPGKPDVFYDPNYALRVCLDEKQTEACVFLYSMMGLHEEAVSLSLKVDVDLAKMEADKVEGDEELRKKLWLCIAKHVIKEEKGTKRENIKKAVAFVNETQGLLKIEDILPFFPEFTLINDFQEAIYASLQEYNARIEELKLEMNDDTLNAEKLRKDINDLSQRSAVTTPDEECADCRRKILAYDPLHGPASLFYVFPCEHCFHTECLINYMLKTGEKAERDRILELKKRMSVLAVEKPPHSKKDYLAEEEESGIHPLDQANAEIAEIVANECPHCGERSVRDLWKPFVPPREAEYAASWEIVKV
ncbi:vacuolar protein sorting-associated protein 18 homolog isoform X2 [Selaginella moellendorffii]|uniref:vacuolar protein sorting-associated protein 18 homolog isoform X2 n=1 Tax=Selaginella moellendorffii TaxID=88036 RepID=UPI000D1D0DAD|nr:vacuolar protein sorting-associated protein 18 homolog isoform X2 [Selaginella moellendorffii]|eukprot:XP_024543759.1 vacuolar protein sorting-associated protein 18 homolog isoform X2 [Selaginella moellendorffii]